MELWSTESGSFATSSYYDLAIDFNSTNLSEISCPEQAAIADSSVHRFRDNFIFFYSPVLILFGLVGNFLVVTVFISTKLKKISSSYFLVGLGVSDSLILLDLFIEWIRFFDINIYARNYFCQSLTFINRSAHFLSVWLVVAFTIERFLVVAFSRRQTTRNTHQGCFITALICITGCLTKFPFLIFFAPRSQQDENRIVCDIIESLEVRFWANFLETREAKFF